MNAANAQRAATGITGLDDILGGGFAPHRLYLVEGMPGSGTTTLACQFLLAGARLSEPVLYVTLSEAEEEIRAVAQSHGGTLDGVRIREFDMSGGKVQVGEPLRHYRGVLTGVPHEISRP